MVSEILYRIINKALTVKRCTTFLHLQDCWLVVSTHAAVLKTGHFETDCLLVFLCIQVNAQTVAKFQVGTACFSCSLHDLDQSKFPPCREDHQITDHWKSSPKHVKHKIKTLMFLSQASTCYHPKFSTLILPLSDERAGKKKATF
jgi:hypothetical protein